MDSSFFRDSNYIDRTDDHPTGTIEIEFVAKKFIVFFCVAGLGQNWPTRLYVFFQVFFKLVIYIKANGKKKWSRIDDIFEKKGGLSFLTTFKFFCLTVQAV